ncbi:hypothetical protein [Phenylobacterium sp.]|uniref:hypothetical protein n=1 Tax=Phenylobacterium sp. TaxID=1871053 RepID=UPI0008B5264D|nr:hypothetical protein [Phenylobacterium sp.]MBA4794765.1 hypothetical protein [Phenylobacterium sp.]OHB40906.1 MAG: hypothetical protein A2882_11570 [Phenylobacterium sp. RIFCSPHIGHO2_01_FULL_70_10]
MDAPKPNTATVSFRAGRARFMARVSMSPAGLLAVGGLVSGILLSTSVLVWSATNVARRRPLASAILTRR